MPAIQEDHPPENAGVPRTGAEDGLGKQVLMSAEVALLLEHHNAKMEQEAQKRNVAYKPNALAQRTLEYAQRFAFSRNPNAIKSIREKLLDYGLSEQEMALVADLQVETVEEAKKIVPSLETRFEDEEINRMLDEVTHIRTQT